MNRLTADYPEEIKALVNEGLRQYFPRSEDCLESIFRAMTYTLFADGKRFRPVLTLLAAEAVGADPSVALPTACAIEFIHTYSLIHDDLPAIDNDDLRRGQPTCHVKFGEDIAILAGDAFFAEAFALILREQRLLSSDDQVLRVLTVLAGATGLQGMVGGQVVDITGMRGDVDQATLDLIHTRKTGSLMGAAAVSGAILGGGNAAQIKAITEYAGHLGLAFQIIDDILDVVGSVDAVGKSIGSDVNNKKTTYASKLGVNKSFRQAQEIAGKAMAALEEAELKRNGLKSLAEFVVRREF